MKFACTIIALYLLISTAFAAQRRAFGPLSFGMSPEEVERVKGNLGEMLTGAEIRKQLIGTERKGKLEEKDQTMSFAFSYSYIPVIKCRGSAK